jgi:hypothetical protein
MTCSPKLLPVTPAFSGSSVVAEEMLYMPQCTTPALTSNVVTAKLRVPRGAFDHDSSGDSSPPGLPSSEQRFHSARTGCLSNPGRARSSPGEEITGPEALTFSEATAMIGGHNRQTAHLPSHLRRRSKSAICRQRRIIRRCGRSRRSVAGDTRGTSSKGHRKCRTHSRAPTNDLERMANRECSGVPLKFLSSPSAKRISNPFIPKRKNSAKPAGFLIANKDFTPNLFYFNILLDT